MTETIDQVVRRLARRFSQAGLDNPMLDARLLVRHVTGMTDAEMIARSGTPLSTENIDMIDKYAERRLAGEPVSRMTGEREFWGLRFALSPDTLDPRADTETLVAAALAQAKALNRPIRILDLGTGSGCILISLLSELPGATGVGIDLSGPALATARSNAVRHDVADRADFRQGSWYDALASVETFDLVVSNPPYIPESDIPGLSVEVRAHDPILALSGGANGYDAYKILLKDLQKVLACDGTALFEIGQGQEKELARLAYDSNMRVSDSHTDLAGIIRVLEIRLGKSM